MHLARRITSLWSACLCRRELVRLQKWFPLNNLKLAKDYTRMKSPPVESFRKKNLEMAKGSSSLNRPRKREGLKIRPRLFQIDRVSNWSLFTEKRRQLPPWFLSFTSIFPKSACLSQALRRLWCFCRFSKLIPTRKLGVAQVALVHRWQISTARSTNSPKNSSSATHAYHPRLFF